MVDMIQKICFLCKILITSSDKDGRNFFTKAAFPANFPLNTTAKIPLLVKYKRKKTRVGQENSKNFRIPNNIWKKH